MSIQPTTADLLGLLANHRRRHILRTVAARGSLSEAELAREITEGTSCAERDIRVTLHHHHLPRLAAHGAIAYEPKHGTVEPGPAFRSLVEALDAVAGKSRRAP